MTQHIYQINIIRSILITAVMITIFRYILKGYRITIHYLYLKVIKKYPKLTINNQVMCKLIKFTIELHLAIGYLILIYIVIISLFKYNP